MDPKALEWIKRKVTSLIIRMLKPFYHNLWVRRVYWEVYAPEIDREWGLEQDDFGIISAILERNKPNTLLDVGCGSGRLFGLYTDHAVPKVMGIDISENALSIARQKFPGIPTLRLSVEEIPFDAGTFDLIICNRTLQHIPPEKIADVVRRLCVCTHRIYINEITQKDGVRPDDGLFFHNYTSLFQRQQFLTEYAGEIPKSTGERQLFTVFKKER